MPRRKTSERRYTARDRKRVGRRAKTVLVIERPAIDLLRLGEVEIRKPSKLDTARLAELFKLGGRYHSAHTVLAKARNQASDAVHALAAAASTREARAAQRDVLSAADSLEASAEELEDLVGLHQVAFLARVALRSLDAVHTASPAELDEILAVLQQLLPQRRAVLVSVPPPATEQRLLAYEMDAAVPVGDGANGYEFIQQLNSPPWSEVTWFAWCAAGRRVKWSVAWVTWPPIERYPFDTIGRAAGLTAEAVRKSRGRQGPF